MNEKDLYKDFNNVNIDEHEFDDVEVNITDLQKHNLKSNLKSKIKNKNFIKVKIAGATVAAALTLIIGIGYTNPSFASQIPILNPIVEMMGHTGDYDKHTDIVNKTVAYNKKSFTVNSVVCYDNTIIIGYTAKSNEKIDEAGTFIYPNLIKVNGKGINVGSSGVTRSLDENTIIGTVEFRLDDIKLPNKFTLDMCFDKPEGVEGNSDLKFNVSKAELGKSTKSYKPNKVIICRNEELTITKVHLTPLNTEISVHSNKKCDVNKAENFQPLVPNFIVIDDKGNELSRGSAKGSPDSKGYNSSLSFAKVNENAKYLTIINCIAHGGSYGYQDKDGKNIVVDNPDPYKSMAAVVPIDTKLPIELSQGNIGKITVNKINFSNNNDSVIIQGITNGKLPNEQTVYLQGDNSKAEIHCVNRTIKKIDANKSEFTIEYSGINSDNNLKLRANNLDYIEYDSRVTIPLK